MFRIRYFALKPFFRNTKRPLSAALADCERGLQHIFATREALGKVPKAWGGGKGMRFVLTAHENHKPHSSHMTGRLFSGQRYVLGAHISIIQAADCTARAPENDGPSSPWRLRTFDEIKPRCLDLQDMAAKQIDRSIKKRAGAGKKGNTLEGQKEM